MSGEPGPPEWKNSFIIADVFDNYSVDSYLCLNKLNLTNSLTFVFGDTGNNSIKCHFRLVKQVSKSNFPQGISIVLEQSVIADWIGPGEKHRPDFICFSSDWYYYFIPVMIWKVKDRFKKKQKEKKGNVPVWR